MRSAFPGRGGAMVTVLWKRDGVGDGDTYCFCSSSIRFLREMTWRQHIRHRQVCLKKDTSKEHHLVTARRSPERTLLRCKWQGGARRGFEPKAHSPSETFPITYATNTAFRPQPDLGLSFVAVQLCGAIYIAYCGH